MEANLKAQEFRIGNYVNSIGIDYIEGNPFPDRNDITIVKVDIEILQNIQNFNNTTEFGLYEPIPLTEEILLKCGFKKRNDCEGYWLNGILFYKEIMSENQKTKIKYLHQLQNLYWCLVGEELEINL